MQKFWKVVSVPVLIAAAALLTVATPVTASISPSDATAISSSVAAAITGATPTGAPAVTDAIKNAALAAMKQYGPAEAKDVAAEIIADALKNGATPQEVGQAMAQAALELGPPFDTAIADAIGGAGDAETLAAFDATVSTAAGGAALAAEADGKSNQTNGAGPLGMGSVAVGGGVSGAATGPSGSGCVKITC